MSTDTPEFGTVDWWLQDVRKGDNDMVPYGPYSITTITPDRVITQPQLVPNEISAIKTMVDATVTRQRAGHYGWDCVIADSRGRCGALGAAVDPITMWWMIDEWRELLPYIYPDDPVLATSIEMSVMGDLDDIHDYHGRN